MRFPNIRAGSREQVEGWFWLLVFLGVMSDLLYLGWLLVRTSAIRANAMPFVSAKEKAPHPTTNAGQDVLAQTSVSYVR